MVQLHLHSHYSQRDGLVQISSLIDKAKSFGMTAVAITEHGHLASSFEFYLECTENGIKPIIGVEAYITNDLRVKRRGERKQHFTLLAKNEVGYRNLIKLMSLAGSEENFYFTPRIDFELLESYREGLIAMSACSFRSVLYLRDESEEWAFRIARRLLNMFGADFYLEIMPHKIDFQRQHNMNVCAISESLGIPVVVTQDTHYLEPGDVEAHNQLMGMQGRSPYGVDSLFFPSEMETEKQLKEHDYLFRRVINKALDETERIADKIEDYGIRLGEFAYPTFVIDEAALKELDK